MIPSSVRDDLIWWVLMYGVDKPQELRVYTCETSRNKDRWANLCRVNYLDLTAINADTYQLTDLGVQVLESLQHND